MHSKVLRYLVEKNEHRQLLRENEEIPKLNYEHIRQEITVVSGDYFQLKCWSCKEEVNSTFTYPLLQPTQRFLNFLSILSP